jgi:hypothetical protein
MTNLYLLASSFWIENESMRKTIINADIVDERPDSKAWLDIENAARVEVTSEDPNFPIESALTASEGPGWRAAEKGKQVIRLVFDHPRALRRVGLMFSETNFERTQEFTLRWAAAESGPFSEIVRQQWTFSPQGSTNEDEDYRVHLENVAILELIIKPDLVPENAFATLARWCVA